jgi:hypothetical protein
MQKVLLVVVALAMSIPGMTASVSAHGEGTYPPYRPIVASTASVVGPNNTFAVGAAHFCANKSITITLTKGSRTYTKSARTDGSGRALVWFKSSNIKPGTYTITAVQGHQCNKTATSTITIKPKRDGSHSLGTSYAGSGIVSAFIDLQAGMDARSADVSVDARAFPYQAQDITRSPGSAGIDSRQLTLTTACGVIGLVGVQMIRRRARRAA